LDGYDEISLTGDFKLSGNKGEQILSPGYLGFNKLNQNDIEGGNTVKESADIFMNVLSNKSTEAQKNAVVANSAIALVTANPQLTIEKAIEKANESLLTGKALEAFKKLLK